MHTVALVDKTYRPIPVPGTIILTVQFTIVPDPQCDIDKHEKFQLCSVPGIRIGMHTYAYPYAYLPGTRARSSESVDNKVCNGYRYWCQHQYICTYIAHLHIVRLGRFLPTRAVNYNCISDCTVIVQDARGVPRGRYLLVEIYQIYQYLYDTGTQYRTGICMQVWLSLYVAHTRHAITNRRCMQVAAPFVCVGHQNRDDTKIVTSVENEGKVISGDLYQR